jgi:predicted  nucleic acid-binding Zn-ribbon protein
MIAEQYINEGIRIRKEYIRNLKEILKLEPLILEKRKSFDKIQEQMENIVYSDLNAVRKTLDLNGRLMDMEKEIKNIQDTIRPFYENIEKLENDSDRLYLSIKEKYPNITNKEIEYEIMSRVDE